MNTTPFVANFYILKIKRNLHSIVIIHSYINYLFENIFIGLSADSSSSDGGDSGGAIAGGVIGGLLAVAIIVIVVIIMLYLR